MNAMTLRIETPVIIGRTDRPDGECYTRHVTAKYHAAGRGMSREAWVYFPTPEDAAISAAALRMALDTATTPEEHNAIIDRWAESEDSFR